MNKPLSLLTLCCAVWCAPISAQASDITAFIDDLNATDFAVRQSARLDLRQALVDATPRELKALESELLQAIGPDRDWATRDWSIRMLELVGTKAAVKPLAALLADPDPRIQDLARRALSANPSRGAAAVLEKAILKAPAAERGPLADALAYRGESRAVRELTAVLKTGSSEAALALGKIGNRAARSALAKARSGATGVFRETVELALLDAGVTDRRLARELAETGTGEAVRVAAFARLLELDARGANAVLTATLSGSESQLPLLFLRAAMDSSLQNDVVARLPDLPEPAQIVVLDAIADQRLRAYEAAVLARLEGASETLHPVVVRALGIVGSDTSFQPLLDLHLANGRDRDVTAALARLNAPASEAALLATVQGDGDVAARAASLRLLVLRNTAGVTALVNQLAQADQEAAIRVAAFKGMEMVGDPESVRVLLDVVLAENTTVKRDAQGSLKKLSANLDVSDYLWNEIYAPAMAAASNDDRRRDVLVIIDGNSGAATATYLQELVLTDNPLRPDAINALRRWTDISGVDAWIAIATTEGATEAEIATAKQGMVRLLASKTVTGFYPDKVDRAAAAMRALAGDAEFRKAVINTYDRQLHWQTRVRIGQVFPEFLSDPAIAPDVQALLDRAKFN
ncbi:HEAT repeat domain-containing protein [Synoicihabitans lomoniglobus]|uniref:HEAT repeat domain-containing protein n=1 Tax=Synoicihabitans lomoniglobus TaxID=2909285 RepID=A0AAE9ZU67_9BACT|nr:HEAT repeat domain-containing protein [Opitutaceae bacterium LMO-M01]WED64366.1 HEAT repeat domain-containing protein [Opitutaceae bacterium LMO-M01]